jgi:hypothetical protein
VVANAPFVLPIEWPRAPPVSAWLAWATASPIQAIASASLLLVPLAHRLPRLAYDAFCSAHLAAIGAARLPRAQG